MSVSKPSRLPRGTIPAVGACAALLAWAALPSPGTPALEPLEPAATTALPTVAATTPVAVQHAVTRASTSAPSLPRAFESSLTELELEPVPEPLGALEAKAKKQAKKAALAAEKAAKRLAKLEAQELLNDTRLADLAAAKVDLEAQRLLALDAVDDALALVAAADAMPKETKAEKSAWKKASNAAKKALGQANKKLKSLDNKLKSNAKTEGKLNATGDKLDDKIDVAEEIVEEADEDFDSLIEAFDFDSLETYPVSITFVDAQGAPIAFAPVELKEPLVPPKNVKTPLEDVTRPGLYLRALTDADGVVNALVDVPGYVDLVDLLIVAPGYEGTYTHETLRDYWGLFAPASRQAFDPDDLDGLTVVLTETEG